MIRRALAALASGVLLGGCTEAAIPYDATGQGEQLTEVDVEVGRGKPYLLMDFDQSKQPYEASATSARSHDASIADVVRSQRDASAGVYEHGHVFVIYGHTPGETDLDVWNGDHLAGTVHVRVGAHSAD